jgi:hypothetical protein
VENDGNVLARELPGGFRAREPAADDMDRMLHGVAR